MKLLFLLFLGIFVLLVTYYGVVLYQKVAVSKELVKRAVGFEKLTTDMSKSLLVLGDSTAVGVGATGGDDTVAGRLAEGMKASHVRNVAISGAVVHEIEEQLSRATGAHYHTILLQVGANDVLQLHSLPEVARELDSVLETLRERGDRVIVLMAGNVGAAAIIPPPLRPLYTKRTLSYHRAFAEVAARHGAIYVNLYAPPETDPFLSHPETYFAPDGLHPSGAGYALWYKRLTEVVTP